MARTKITPTLHKNRMAIVTLEENRKHYDVKSLTAIRRVDLLKAYWRIISLTLIIPLLTDKAAAKAKLEKYRAVLAVFRKEN